MQDESVTSELQIVLRWVMSGLIEALFLSCWVIIQWGVNEYVVSRFSVNGIDATVLTIAQWLFGLATLSPIVFRIVRLIVIMAIRTFRDIRTEWETTQ